MKQKEKRKSCPNCATNFSRRAFYYHKQKHHDGNVWTCGNRQAKIYPSNVPLQAGMCSMSYLPDTRLSFMISRNWSNDAMFCMLLFLMSLVCMF